MVGNKTKAALDAHLKVILCVGETLAEREAGNTTEVVNEQLRAVVDILKDASYWRYVVPLMSAGPTRVPSCSHIVIAYEPVWAIGTGKVATAAQAQEAHAEIRQFLKTGVSESVAATTRVIYGGSVTAANCKELGAYVPVFVGLVLNALGSNSEATRRRWVPCGWCIVEARVCGHYQCKEGVIEIQARLFEHMSSALVSINVLSLRIASSAG